MEFKTIQATINKQAKKLKGEVVFSGNRHYGKTLKAAIRKLMAVGGEFDVLLPDSGNREYLTIKADVREELNTILQQSEGDLATSLNDSTTTTARTIGEDIVIRHYRNPLYIVWLAAQTVSEAQENNCVCCGKWFQNTISAIRISKKGKVRPAFFKLNVDTPGQKAVSDALNEYYESKDLLKAMPKIIRKAPLLEVGDRGFMHFSLPKDTELSDFNSMVTYFTSDVKDLYESVLSAVSYTRKVIGENKHLKDLIEDLEIKLNDTRDGELALNLYERIHQFLAIYEETKSPQGRLKVYMEFIGRHYDVVLNNSHLGQFVERYYSDGWNAAITEFRKIANSHTFKTPLREVSTPEAERAVKFLEENGWIGAFPVKFSPLSFLDGKEKVWAKPKGSESEKSDLDILKEHTKERVEKKRHQLTIPMEKLVEMLKEEEVVRFNVRPLNSRLIIAMSQANPEAKQFWKGASDGYLLNTEESILVQGDVHCVIDIAELISHQKTDAGEVLTLILTGPIKDTLEGVRKAPSKIPGGILVDELYPHRRSINKISGSIDVEGDIEFTGFTIPAKSVPQVRGINFELETKDKIFDIRIDY